MGGDNENVFEDFINSVISQALKHVPFDGWSNQTLKKVCQELSIPTSKLYQMFPRGGVDLAIAFHGRDDSRFLEQFLTDIADQPSRRVRDSIKIALISRLDVAAENKEAVKRSMSLLTSPLYVSDGIRALWNTCDKIWSAIEDDSKDFNWYSKRLILSSVYSATLIFWMEDDSKDFQDTKDFIGRRISDVMAFEQLKVNLRKSRVWEKFKNKMEERFSEIIKNKQGFPGS